MKKRKVSLAFLRLPIPQKIQKGRYIVQMMTGNINYPAPDPDLATVIININTLETKHEQALDGGKSKKLQQQNAEDVFDDNFRDLGAYVQDESNGDGEKITGSGFDLAKEKEAAQLLGAVQGLKSAPGKNEQEVDLKWNTLKGTKSYVIQAKEEIAAGGGATTPPSSGSPSQPAADTGKWITLDTPVTKTKFTVGGLKSGTRYSFRVAGVNSKGRGVWSDITICVAR